MKQALGWLFVTLLLVPGLRAQRHCLQEAFVQSLLPISWSFHWSCLDRPHPTSGDWNRTIDTVGILWDTCGVLGDTIWYKFSTYGPSVEMIIDTSRKLVNIWLSESSSQAMFNAHLALSHARPYVISGEKRSVLITNGYTFEWNSYPDCQSGGSGWIGLGGATPPASVKLIDSHNLSTFSGNALSGGLLLKFSSLEEARAIRIFDLLGREVARIDVPAGAESAELNTSHIAPGMYIAQMGTQAVKFVVR